MSISKSYSVTSDLGRFGDVFFNVIDSTGWTVACYMEAEDGEAKATYHAATGTAPHAFIQPLSAEGIALLASIPGDS